MSKNKSNVRQYKMVKREGDEALHVDALLLSRHTMAAAETLPGVSGKCHMMYQTWTSQAAGSSHPPWNVLVERVPTALECLPASQAKTVKQFKRLFSFIQNEFAAHQPEVAKFEAADRDPRFSSLGSCTDIFSTFVKAKK
mmetsp:Transcript_32220/g.97114  ORF Transcript_32220/g.97114 Transcript_32220/m.97114 type:complete len:140 (+) Transcript_32220:540-959(+)